MDRVQAIDITEAIVNHIETLGLSLSHLCGQSYDGASTRVALKVVCKLGYWKSSIKLFICIIKVIL